MKTEIVVEFTEDKFWVSLRKDSEIKAYGKTASEAFENFTRVYPEFFKA